MTDSIIDNYSNISNQKIDSMKLSLNSDQKIKVSKIKEIIKSTLANSMMTLEFDINNIKEFTDNIKIKLKALRLDRYKIIVQSYLGEQKNQGINLVNKCLFDTKNDYCITEQISINEFFCFVVVYLVYVY